MDRRIAGVHVALCGGLLGIVLIAACSRPTTDGPTEVSPRSPEPTVTSVTDGGGGGDDGGGGGGGGSGDGDDANTTLTIPTVMPPTPNDHPTSNIDCPMLNGICVPPPVILPPTISSTTTTSKKKYAQQRCVEFRIVETMPQKLSIRAPLPSKRRRSQASFRSGKQQTKIDEISKGLRLFADVIAPTTIITALLVYVGWIRYQAFYGYFGITQGVLRPSVQDYALRSTDITFGAVTRLVGVALVSVVLDRLLSHFTKRRRTKIAGWIIIGLALSGLAFLSAGFLFMVGITASFVSPFVGTALLGVGAVLVIRFGPIALTPRGSRRSFGGFAEVALYTTLILALFWAATLYAQDMGQKAARSIDEHPSTLPLATIFSDDYLDLPGANVSVAKVEGQGESFFRYTGLFLMTYSNGRWFLITGHYNDDYRSSVVVLQDSPSIRLEVAALP